MQSRASRIVVSCVSAVVVTSSAFFWHTSQNEKYEVAYQVEKGTVEHIVSVSGTVDTYDTASLSFPTTGVITDIFVIDGQAVEKGQLLATLANSGDRARITEAEANLRRVLEEKNLLALGSSAAVIAAAEQTIRSSETSLKAAQNSAHATLFSTYTTTLKVITEDIDPFFGNPRASIPGVRIAVGNTDHVNDLRVSLQDKIEQWETLLDSTENTTLTEQIETARDTINTAVAILDIFITVTNKAPRTDTLYGIAVEDYTADLIDSKATLERAQYSLQSAVDSLESSKSAVFLTEAEAEVRTKGPELPSLLSADAVINAAEAQLQQVVASVADRSITAPFSGIIARVHQSIGEVASIEPVIDVVATNNLEIVATVNESDFQHIVPGQRAVIRFDANTTESITGTVRYISPTASPVQGVAYFEVRIELRDTPDWVRVGLNADVDIITEERPDVVRIPTYLIQDETVIIQQDDKFVSTPVTVGLVGDNGFTEVSGISEGTVIYKP